MPLCLAPQRYLVIFGRLRIQCWQGKVCRVGATPLPHPVADGAPLSPNPTDSLICGSNTTYKLRLRRETTAKRKQAGWNDEYLLKVLSNWHAIAAPVGHCFNGLILVAGLARDEGPW